MRPKKGHRIPKEANLTEWETNPESPAGIFCRLQVAGCGLKFNYNWKTAGTKDTYIHQGFLHNVVGVFHMVKTRATSSFGKYIQQPFQMIFQMFSGYFR